MEAHDRLRKAREDAGFEDAHAAAQRFGWKYSTYAGHENGSRGMRQAVIERYARAFRVSPSWLAYGVDQERDLRTEQPVELGEADSVDSGQDEFVGIPRYNVQLSGGGGRFVDQAVLRDHIPFTREFIRRRLDRTGTEGLVIFEAEGSSMEPNILAGDLVMIDRNRRVADGSIMAFRLEDGAFIKRLQKVPGGFRYWSDNPAAGGEQVIQAADADGFEVIGKAVWIGRTL